MTVGVGGARFIQKEEEVIRIRWYCVGPTCNTTCSLRPQDSTAIASSGMYVYYCSTYHKAVLCLVSEWNLYS